MGLDCYFKIKKYHTPVFDLPRELHLCSGMLSGNGSDGSFRGKVYASFMDQIAGLDLYQEEIEHEVIENTSRYLDKLTYTDSWMVKYDLSEQEFEDLRTLFKAAADIPNCVLLGWW
jgi:uncharacterized protein CbrC (UPF0167 family)